MKIGQKIWYLIGGNNDDSLEQTKNVSDEAINQALIVDNFEGLSLFSIIEDLEDYLRIKEMANSPKVTSIIGKRCRSKTPVFKLTHK